MAKTFLSVANLTQPPTALFKPGIVARVLWSGGKRPAMRPAAVTAEVRQLETVAS